MAALRAPSAGFLEAFLPVVRATLTPTRPIRESPFRTIPLFPRLQLSHTLPGVWRPIPSLIGAIWQGLGLSPADIWNGILNAVPKKKTSHMKKRHRQMAGKALKDVTALNKCSACGRPKRAHVLCPYCVNSIRRWIATKFQTPAETEQKKLEFWEKVNQEREAKGKKPLKKDDEEVEWIRYGKREHQSFRAG